MKHLWIVYWYKEWMYEDTESFAMTLVMDRACRKDDMDPETGVCGDDIIAGNLVVQHGHIPADEIGYWHVRVMDSVPLDGQAHYLGRAYIP